MGRDEVTDFALIQYFMGLDYLFSGSYQAMGFHLDDPLFNIFSVVNRRDQQHVQKMST